MTQIHISSDTVFNEVNQWFDSCESAAKYGDLKALMCLHKHGYPIGRSAILSASYGNADCLEYSLTYDSRSSGCCMMIAVINKKYDCIAYLLKVGVPCLDWMVTSLAKEKNYQCLTLVWKNMHSGYPDKNSKIWFDENHEIKVVDRYLPNREEKMKIAELEESIENMKISTDQNIQIVLNESARNGDYDKVKELCNKGYNVNEQVVFEAIAFSNTNLITVLTELGQLGKFKLR